MTQTHDVQSGYGQYGAVVHPPLPTPPPGAEPRRPRRSLVALVAATALVAGASGGAVGAVLADDGSGVGALRSSGGSVAVTSTSTGSGSVAGAAAAIMPSTVVIDVTGSTGGRAGPATGGSGSGVVLDAEGHILTNAHVVTAGGAVSRPVITVTFADGQIADASVVGVDESSDLAVIQVAAGVEGLTPAVFADSDQLAVGQAVVAVGAPLGLSGTVTEGIVSAVERPVRTGSSQDASTVLDAVQTDAAINPGNSGGPLVDLAGSVVGINSAIATVSGAAGQSGSIGVGFAIPSNDARDIAGQLVADGTSAHASLGVSASETEDGSGAQIQSVEPGGAAAEAGLQPGDVVTAVADRQVRDLDTLLAAIRDHQPGDTVTLAIRRDGAEESITVTLGSRTA